MIDGLPKPDWQSDDGSIVLYRGDCLELLPKFPDGCVDCVVTDPPYGISYQSNRCADGPRFDVLSGDGAVPTGWACRAARCMSDDGAIVCFCRWDTREAFRVEIDAHVPVKGAGVWDRGVHGMGDLNGGIAPRHDDFLFAARPGFRFVGPRLMSVLTHSRVDAASLLHPTQKPTSLMVEIVRSVGESILDPFLGSGTTAVACIKTGRKCIGIELEPKYFDIAVKRCQQAFDDFGLYTQDQTTEKQMELAI